MSDSNIEIIKGEDKEYLVFEIYHEYLLIGGGINPIISPPTGKVLKEIEFEVGQSITLDDKEKIFYIILKTIIAIMAINFILIMINYIMLKL